MDHRPSPSEVHKLEQQAIREANNEAQASQELDQFLNTTTPQRKEYFLEETERVQP